MENKITDKPRAWDEFLTSRYWEDLLKLAEVYPYKRSLEVKFTDLDHFNPDLADELLENPEETLEAARAALIEVDLPIDAYMDRANVRVVGLPKRLLCRDIRIGHEEKLVALEGMVRNISKSRMTVVSLAVVCHRCGYTFFVEPAKFRAVAGAVKCQNQACDRGGPFSKNLAKSKKVDKQVIKLQESPEDLKGVELPEAMEVVLTDDLVKMVQPGNRVIINGIVKIREMTSNNKEDLDYEHYIKAVSVEVLEREFEEVEISTEDEMKIKALAAREDVVDVIQRSIAPSIYGYEYIKVAMALQLVSSPSQKQKDGTEIRGDIHILLIGDPGIAKSQLLKYSTNIAPRGIYTSGKGVSTAGLTAAVVKDELGDGRWTLEAGALPMADKGICAIDELDKMQPGDRDALHEGLEQQSISISKAGLSATLRCRCAALAAANPEHGRFDRSEIVSSQIKIQPTLLSRFDLMFVLFDEPNREKDSKLADHVLLTYYDKENSAVPEIEPDLLRKYIAYARKNVSPVLTIQTKDMLKEFYLGVRDTYKGRADQPVPTTARQLHALVRLAIASARLRLSSLVEEQDARRAIEITQICLKQVGTDPETGGLDASAWDMAKTKTITDKTKLIQSIVMRLADKTGFCTWEEVIESAKAQGIAEERAESIMERLNTDGWMAVSGGVIKPVYKSR